MVVQLAGALVMILFLISSIWTVQQAKYYLEVKGMVD